MTDRVKFQVWSPVQHRWRTAYVRYGQIDTNINSMVMHGFVVRTNGKHYYELQT